MSENEQESVFRSIREMKQDIFNLTSIFMGNQEDHIRVQVHDTSKEELIKELSDLRRNVNQMALTLEKLTAKDKVVIAKDGRCPQPIERKVIATQTDNTPDKPIAARVTLSPTTKNDWHYLLVSKIPAFYTANQLAQYFKAKLGTTDFIRCFPMLSDKDSLYSEFKVGVKNIMHLEQLKNTTMWPPGTIITTFKPPSKPTTISTPPPPSSTSTGQLQSQASTNETRGSPLTCKLRESKTVKLRSDREAIAACKSNEVLYDNPIIVVENTTKENDKLAIDPLTPPIVRLSQNSDADGRYLLSRLRDPSILKSLRLFLAYLHDQPSNVCFEGQTKTSIKLALASEGLPSDVDSLRKLYFRFHESYNIDSAEVEADLSAFRSFFSSEKMLQLQKIRESHGRYFSGSPSKTKNF